ncbi:MAG: hypothetical protein H6828_13220 [Planctomycetes bacterium]|nr:hypothetical protein [Planctomycetota bacterium]
MITIEGESEGKSGKGKVDRVLELEIREGRAYLWIHAPGKTGKNDGLSIEVDPEQLAAKLVQAAMDAKASPAERA